MVLEQLRHQRSTASGGDDDEPWIGRVVVKTFVLVVVDHGYDACIRV